MVIDRYGAPVDIKLSAITDATLEDSVEKIKNLLKSKRFYGLKKTDRLVQQTTVRSCVKWYCKLILRLSLFSHKLRYWLRLVVYRKKDEKSYAIMIGKAPKRIYKLEGHGLKSQCRKSFNFGKSLVKWHCMKMVLWNL